VVTSPAIARRGEPRSAVPGCTPNASMCCMTSPGLLAEATRRTRSRQILATTGETAQDKANRHSYPIDAVNESRTRRSGRRHQRQWHLPQPPRVGDMDPRGGYVASRCVISPGLERGAQSRSARSAGGPSSHMDCDRTGGAGRWRRRYRGSLLLRGIALLSEVDPAAVAGPCWARSDARIGCGPALAAASGPAPSAGCGYSAHGCVVGAAVGVRSWSTAALPMVMTMVRRLVVWWSWWPGCQVAPGVRVTRSPVGVVAARVPA
jgi:hypothetical protein